MIHGNISMPLQNGRYPSREGWGWIGIVPKPFAFLLSIRVVFENNYVRYGSVIFVLMTREGNVHEELSKHFDITRKIPQEWHQLNCQSSDSLPADKIALILDGWQEEDVFQLYVAIYLRCVFRDCRFDGNLLSGGLPILVPACFDQ